MPLNQALQYQLPSKLNPMASVFVCSAQLIRDDNSYVNPYSTLPAIDKPSHDVGIIGDQRRYTAVPSSTASYAKGHNAARPASPSLVRDLLEGSTPDSDCHKILKPYQQTGVSRVPWGASLNHTATGISKATSSQLYTNLDISSRYNNKYLGMAEITGPLNAQNTLPIRWIVAKDVCFALFKDLKYHNQADTQVRHSNTISGEAGHVILQRCFEA